MGEDNSFDMAEFLKGKQLNPDSIFAPKNYKGTAILTPRQAIQLACSAAVRQTNDDRDKNGNFINGAADILMREIITLSKSVGGKALDKYVESLTPRIQAKDRQTKVMFDGQENE